MNRRRPVWPEGPASGCFRAGRIRSQCQFQLAVAAHLQGGGCGCADRRGRPDQPGSAVLARRVRGEDPRPFPGMQCRRRPAGPRAPRPACHPEAAHARRREIRVLQPGSAGDPGVVQQPHDGVTGAPHERRLPIDHGHPGHDQQVPSPQPPPWPDPGFTGAPRPCCPARLKTQAWARPPAGRHCWNSPSMQTRTSQPQSRRDTQPSDARPAGCLGQQRGQFA